MLLHIVARGRIGRGPEAELIDRYLKRVAWPTRITELPDTGGKVPAVEPGTRIVMLDEKGRDLPSMAFAGGLPAWALVALTLAIGSAGSPGLMRR